VRIGDIPFALRHSVASRGVMRSVEVVRRKAVNRLFRTSTPAEQPFPHPFDAKYGTDTGGMVNAQELRDSRGKKSIYNIAYYGTPPSMFLQALARLKINFADFTFIDLGAGKGRVLLLASDFPFRQVIGVEFSEHLASVANRNISLYHPSSRHCEDLRCIPGDASEFSFPPGPLVIFMWNPFVGVVFDRMLANLQKSLIREPREVYLLYLNPECGRQLDNCSGLNKIWESTLEMTQQDYSFYEVGPRTEICAGWRSSLPSHEPAGIA
jgi:Histone methylation protein DOT1